MQMKYIHIPQGETESRVIIWNLKLLFWNVLLDNQRKTEDKKVHLPEFW